MHMVYDSSLKQPPPLIIVIYLSLRRKKKLQYLSIRYDPMRK